MKNKELEKIELKNSEVITGENCYENGSGTDIFIYIELKQLKEDVYLIKELKEAFLADYKFIITKQIENDIVNNYEDLKEMEEIEESIELCSFLIEGIKNYIDIEYKELKSEAIEELKNKLIEIEKI